MLDGPRGFTRSDFDHPTVFDWFADRWFELYERQEHLGMFNNVASSLTAEPAPQEMGAAAALLDRYHVGEIVDWGPRYLEVAYTYVGTSGPKDYAFCLFDDGLVESQPERVAFWFVDGWALPTAVVPAGGPSLGDAVRSLSLGPVVRPLTRLEHELRSIPLDRDPVSQRLLAQLLDSSWVGREAWSVLDDWMRNTYGQPLHVELLEQAFHAWAPDSAYRQVSEHVAQISVRKGSGRDSGWQRWVCFDRHWAAAYPDLVAGVRPFMLIGCGV